jgi:hypothetical protein
MRTNLKGLDSQLVHQDLGFHQDIGFIGASIGGNLEKPLQRCYNGSILGRHHINQEGNGIQSLPNGRHSTFPLFIFRNFSRMDPYRIQAIQEFLGSEAPMTNDLREYLLEMQNDSKDFTTRGIDEYIHKGNQYDGGNVYRHLQHQMDIIRLIGREHLEMAVFNDDRVRYPFRPQLSGTTGTMSNVLTSYFFTLYNAMLQIPGMEVNATYDLQQCHYLACLFDFDSESGAVILPKTEFDSFCSIIHTLRDRVDSDLRNLGYEGTPTVFFTEEDLEGFRGKCAAAAEVVDGYSFVDKKGRFITSMDPVTKNLIQRGPVSFGYCVGAPHEHPSFAALRADPVTVFLIELEGEGGRYGPYAYNPCYIHTDNEISIKLNGFSRTSLDGIVKHMERIHAFMTTLEEYPQRDPTRCLEPMVRFGNMMGGTRRRHKKRNTRRKSRKGRKGSRAGQ